MTDLDTELPHAAEFNVKYDFLEEPEEDNKDSARPESHDNDSHWQFHNRPPWQQHSALGASLNNADTEKPAEPMHECINPPGIDWSVNSKKVSSAALPPWWMKLRASASTYTDDSLTIESLQDDHQCLFVHLVLKHVQDIITCIRKKTKPVPLRLLLLGTAGTGKTRSIQTLLQHLHAQLQRQGLPAEFIRVAAPTGTAAFNIRFNATTVHRLIHWFRPPYFHDLLADSDSLAKFQEYMENTQLLLIDEISMVGRQMMGRIDARMRQAKAGTCQSDTSLGGLSCICVGDPAQCEAIMDQQMFDRDVHKDTCKDPVPDSAIYSNRGLMVYGEFQEVIILSTVHRMRFIDKPSLTEEEKKYNDRGSKFMDMLRKLRDLRWTLQDYYGVCQRKRSNLPPSERARFADAPLIMDFRRETTENPENNCTFFNRMKLRRHALENNVPVARFDASHTGIDQSDGMQLEDIHFRGLCPTMEICEGARIILIHNLSVEHGLLNGTQGAVRMIIYDTVQGPSNPNEAMRMPRAIVVDFPKYVGPPFFDTTKFPDRATWIPIEPREMFKDDDASISRIQYPFVLGWALTPWKAQGMTLDKAVVRLGRAASSPGVAFVALSRVRHPDDLMLDDEFPDMATIMRQTQSAGYIKRQEWEKLMKIRFSQTLRRHLRDPALYDPEMTWTEEESIMAAEMLRLLKSAQPGQSPAKLEELLLDKLPHANHTR